MSRDVNQPQGSVPRNVYVDIEYQQIDAVTKRLVKMQYTLLDLGTNFADLNYTLHVSFTPLGYVGLINEFAFSPTLYTILCGLVAVLSIIAVVRRRIFLLF